jgi:hypothetical protein
MQDIHVQILDLLRKLLRKLGCDIDDGASPQDILEALVKAIQSGRTSWRPEGFAWKHSVSPSFIYGEIRDKRLRARKPCDGVTIITEEDEAEWLEAMPVIGAPKDGEAVASINECDSKEAPDPT